MIEEILPSRVAAVETYADLPGARPPAQELAAVARAVERRRREFATGRECARRALRQLGMADVAIPVGERGEPEWPASVIGSITHCEGYRACALARTDDLDALGIDAEPHAALPDGLEHAIAGAGELRWLRELEAREPGVHWGRLLFCAKESVYKAWFPRAKRGLAFEDVLVRIDLASRSFSAELAEQAVTPADPRDAFSGRWLIRRGLVLTAVASPAPARARQLVGPAARLW